MVIVSEKSSTPRERPDHETQILRADCCYTAVLFSPETFLSTLFDWVDTNWSSHLVLLFTDVWACVVSASSCVDVSYCAKMLCNTG